MHVEDNEQAPLVQHESQVSQYGQFLPHNCNNANGTVSCIKTLANDDRLSESNKRKLLWVTGFALLFFVAELVAGYFANALTLMSDAFHLLSNVTSFAVALTSAYLAERPPTHRHTYGFHRAEVLAALISVLAIWTMTSLLVLAAIDRLQHPQEINASLMCLTAAAGVAVNAILASVMGGRPHRHDSLIDYKQNQKKHELDANLRPVSLHALGDVLCSIGVLTASIVLLFKPEYTLVDPLCTFVLAILVLGTTIHIIKDCLNVLMECAPSHIQLEAIERTLIQVTGVMAIHDLHIWMLSPGNYSLTAHIVIARATNAQYDAILHHCQRCLVDQFGIHHTTLQIETEEIPFIHHCQPDLCCPQSR